MASAAAERRCWLCGTRLHVCPAGGASYCESCEVFTGAPAQHDHSPGYPWRRADGRQVLELYLDHSAVHAPSPA